MYYIVYKTTNLINGKVYIGIHKQPMLEFDGYFGSGLLLNRAIVKWGKDNFARETLFSYHTLDESRSKEREIVNEEFCKRCDTYNISIGGTGGNTRAGYTTEEKRISYDKAKETLIANGNNIYEGEKLLEAQEHMLKIRIQPDNTGKIHTEEQNINQSKIMTGRIAITNGIENRKILSHEEIPEDWVRGFYLQEDKKFKGHSPEVLKILSDKRQNKIYITDGFTNILVDSVYIIPEGWYQGLTRHKKDKLMFITDGVISRKIKLDAEIPEGWRKGRTFKSGNKNE